MDVCGPVKTPSIEGSRYCLTFPDDASRKVIVYFLEAKGQVFEAYEDFKSMVYVLREVLECRDLN